MKKLAYAKAMVENGADTITIIDNTASYERGENSTKNTLFLI